LPFGNNVKQCFCLLLINIWFFLTFLINLLVFFAEKRFMKIKGSDIVARIDGLLAERKESRKALVVAKAVSSVVEFSQWIARGTIPRADVALAIADYFGVSVRWLLYGKDDAGLNREDRKVLNSWKRLTNDNHRTIRLLVDTMIKAQGEDTEMEVDELGEIA
jgi:hypothetical protein